MISFLEYRYKYSSMLKFAAAELLIEGKSDSELRRMMTLEAL